MTPEPLFLPRRLAIRLLAEAQKAPGGETHGWVGEKNGEPVSVWPAAPDAQQRLEQSGETIWASYHLHAGAAGPSAVRQLIMSLDTKGVLQLRCWECEAGACIERILKIRD